MYTGQCPVPQRRATLELASFGNSLRYNSPDMSGAHGTVRCNSGATATSVQRSPATALNARQSAQKSGMREVAHRTLYSTCPVCHRTSRRAQQSELQWSEPNGLVTWLGHRTVRCAIDRQPPPTVKFGGWSYKYPNHPTIHCIQVFHFSTTYKSSSIQF